MSDVVELSSELIRRHSVTPDDAGCQQVPATRLAQWGFQCEHLRFGGHRRISGRRTGQVRRCWYCSATPDVVPPGPLSAWTSDPFVPTVRDGVLYGRGTADMKCSVAACTIALERFVDAHPDHPGTVALLVTSDEEGPAHDGVKKVAGLFRERGQKIDWCITGEPSSKEALGDLLRVGRRGTLTAPCRCTACRVTWLSAQGAQPHPQGTACAGRTGRAPVGRGLRDPRFRSCDGKRANSHQWR